MVIDIVDFSSDRFESPIAIVRLKDGGRTRILKLKDWPTKKDFASVFPTRLHDLMSNIPFGNNEN